MASLGQASVQRSAFQLVDLLVILSVFQLASLFVGRSEWLGPKLAKPSGNPS